MIVNNVNNIIVIIHHNKNSVVRINKHSNNDCQS